MKAIAHDIMPVSAEPAATVAGTSRSFNHPINHLRGVAVLPIVAGHCYNVIDWDPTGPAFSASKLWIELNIIFIFISGYLFQHLIGRFTYDRYLVGKLRNVVVPYVVVSLPALAIYAFDLKDHPSVDDVLSQLGLIERVAYMLVTGAHMGPFWFIPMIVVLYVAAPLFVLIDRFPILYLSILPLYVLSVTVFPRPLHDADPLMAAAHYVPVYMLGMMISHYASTILPLLTRHWKLMVYAASASIATTLLAAHLGVWVPRIWLTTVICLAVLALLLRFTAERWPLLDLLAANSFGVFFLHGYFVAAYRILADRYAVLAQGSLLTFAASFLIALCASLAATLAVRRVAGRRSRLLIGT